MAQDNEIYTGEDKKTVFSAEVVTFEDLQKKIKSATLQETWIRDFFKAVRVEGKNIRAELDAKKSIDIDSFLTDAEKLDHEEAIALLEKKLELQQKRIKKLKYLHTAATTRLSELTKLQEETALNNATTEQSVSMREQAPLQKKHPTYWKKNGKKYAIFSAVFAPAVFVLCYFLCFASPMYVSQASFAIRSADNGVSAGTDLASVFLKTPSSANDVYILEDYIRSLDLAQTVDRELKVVAHYSDKQYDVISRLWQEPTQDELLSYWRKTVTPELDPDTGIVVLNVRAYTPQMAQQMTQAVLSRSEALVNAMNKRAQSDAVALAKEEVSRAEERVRLAQSAMRAFRDSHSLIDPQHTAAGLQDLISGLEAEATSLRTRISEAQSFMRVDAPALKSLNQRLAAVEKQLSEEKQRVAGQSHPQDNLNAIVGDYEDLTIQAEFAQKRLVSAMTSLEQARIQQASQTRYVVAYQQPTLPDESLYPRPFLFSLYVLLGTMLLLGIFSLVWASIREHAGF